MGAKQAGIWSPLYPISSQLVTSHRAGWALHWQLQLRSNDIDAHVLTGKDDPNEYGTLYLYHGMEFKGALNLQGGLTGEVMDRVTRLTAAINKRKKFIHSLDIQMPDYGATIWKRAKSEGRNNWQQACDALSKACKLVPHIQYPHAKPKRLVLGDSHALSQTTLHTNIIRLDGQTMYGAVQGPLMNLVPTSAAGDDKLKMLTVYFGNIDIRHHLCRPGAVRLDSLVHNYELQLQALKKQLKPEKLEVVQPLPIEDESRLIPTSGFYKGTAFYGSWAERNKVRKELDDALAWMCSQNRWFYYQHPLRFYEPDGKLKLDCMEKPRSVHIRPTEYRRPLGV